MSKEKTIKVYRDGDSRDFTIEAWDSLPPGKYGWTKKADEPEEVEHLKAADLIEMINKAKTADAVNALLTDGETRSTVLNAADARKGELAGK